MKKAVGLLAFLFLSPALAAIIVTGGVTVLSFIQSVDVATTETSARIGWLTLDNSTSLVEYGPTAGYGTNISVAANTTNHSIIIGGLDPLTAYHYKVWSCTAAECYNTSDANFTTQAATPTPIPVVVVVGGGGTGGTGGGGGPAFGLVTATPTPIPTPASAPEQLPFLIQQYDLSGALGGGEKMVGTRRLEVRDELLSPTGYLSAFTLAIKNTGKSGVGQFEVRETIPAIVGDAREMQFSIAPERIEGNDVVWKIGSLAPGGVIIFGYYTTKKIPASYMGAYSEPRLRPVATPTPLPTPTPAATPAAQEKPGGTESGISLVWSVLDRFLREPASIVSGTPQEPGAAQVLFSILAWAVIVAAAVLMLRRRRRAASSKREERLAKIVGKVREYRKMKETAR